MKHETYINGVDAYATYGITLQDSALATLMTPPEMKDYITSEIRTENGKRYFGNARQASRELSLGFNLTASSREEFFKRYNAFCEVLTAGKFTLRTKYQPGVTYTLYYNDCSQYQQLIDGIAKFTLKVTEPNPADR